jgi:hypothetical protein
MLDKLKLKIIFKNKTIVIVITSSFVLILKQGMLYIRGSTVPPNLF